MYGHMCARTHAVCVSKYPLKSSPTRCQRECVIQLCTALLSHHITLVQWSAYQRERGRGGEQTFGFLETSIKSGKVKVEGEMCRQEEEVWEMENRETTEGCSCFYYCSSEWWCWGLVLHLCGERSHSKGNNSKEKYLCNCTTFIINILHISKVFRCWTHLWQQNIQKRPCCLRKDLKLNFFF